MSKIKLTLPVGETLCTGKLVSFKAPCDCTGVTAVTINDIDYTLVDGCNTSITNLSEVFVAGAMVTVTLDVEQHRAYISGSGGTPIVDTFPVKDSGHLVTSGGVHAFVDDLVGDGIEKISETKTLSFPSVDNKKVTGKYDYDTGAYNYSWTNSTEYPLNSVQRCFVNDVLIDGLDVQIASIPNEYGGYTTRSASFSEYTNRLVLFTNVSGTGAYEEVTMSADSVNVSVTTLRWVAKQALNAESCNSANNVTTSINGMSLWDIFDNTTEDDGTEVMFPEVKKAVNATTANYATTCTLSYAWQTVNGRSFTVSGSAASMVAVLVYTHPDCCATRLIPLIAGRHCIEQYVETFVSAGTELATAFYATVTRTNSSTASVTLTAVDSRGKDISDTVFAAHPAKYKLLK